MSNEIGQLKVNGKYYDISDKTARNQLKDVVSEVSGSVNIYPAFSVDKWFDNCIKGSIIINDENYCSSSPITVKANTKHLITHKPYKVLDGNGALITILEDINLETGGFEYSINTPSNSSEISIVIDKREFGGTTDINTAVENFNSVFMLVEGNTLPTEFVPYVKGGYKLKDNVELPDNIEIPNVPTKVSELENDSGFITKADIPTDESYELIGETPFTLDEKSNVKLASDVETTYEAKTPTVWNFDDVFANGDYTLTRCTLEKEDDHYKITSGDTVTAHYQSYVKLLIPVEAGKTYNLCFDASASKKNTTDEPNDWSGHLIVYDGDTTSSSAILANSVIPDLKTVHEITPTANVLHIRYFPARSDAQNKAGSIARFNSMWLNEGTETALTEIYNVNGTMDGSIVLQKVPKGATITATPTAKIYTKAPTDKTLTKSDVPADAQATGKRIEAVKNLLPLYGKTIVNFGDSIFGNAQPPVDISTHLANKTGATVYNCGFGGCRMTPHTMTEYDAFCMYNLADAITTKDFTKQNEAVASGNLAERYSAGLERLKSIDFSNVDIITIAYGTNDFNGYGATLDNAENPLDTSAFGGALRYSIEKILTAYPNLRIFVLSITWNFSVDSDGNYTEDSNTRINSGGQTIQQYNAKLKEVAEEYNLPYVDDYNIGIGKFNRYQYFNTNDGTHHKETGRKLIASHLAKELY